MKMKLKPAIIVFALFLSGLLPAGTARAAGPLVVRLVTGQTISGDLAAATDAECLWLRHGCGAVVVLRPIEWDNVATASVLGREFTGGEFRGMVEKIIARRPPAATRPAVITLRGPAEPSWPAAETPAAWRTAPRVVHLATDAEVARWSDTVEADGILVRIYPLNARGALVPVRGTLEVELTGWRQTGPWREQPFCKLARWTEEVRPEHFGPRGAVYRLPFQADHPDFDLSLAPRGAVHARLSVPGQGTFDATQPDVRSRPYSAVRDQLQQVTGARFFPGERVSGN
jgi:hypothetical protein